MIYQNPYNVTNNPYQSDERVIPFLTGVALGTAFPNRYFSPFPFFYQQPYPYFYPYPRFPRRRRRFYR
mgnify:CR=1 FL=1|jgi:hypothetical protein